MRDTLDLLNRIVIHEDVSIDKNLYILGLNKIITEVEIVVLCGDNNETMFLSEYIKKYFDKDLLQLDTLDDLDSRYIRECIFIVGDARYQWEQYIEAKENMCEHVYIVDETLKALICNWAE